MSDSNGTKSIFIGKLRDSMGTDIDIDFKPKNIGLICSNSFIGMGEFVSDCTNESCTIPSTVTVDTRIPGWVDENSLIILMTDRSRKEILPGMLNRLRNKGCGIILITDFDTEASKGILYRHKIDGGDECSFLGETLGTLASIFDSLKLASRKDIEEYLSSIDDRYSEFTNMTDFTRFSRKNVMISYPPNMRSTAAVWKNMFTNKLGRSVFATEYPEFDHNEIVGWCMSPDQSNKFVNVFICDENTDRLSSVITESLTEVLGDHGVEIITMKIGGKNNLEKNILGFLMGEAIANGGKR